MSATRRSRVVLTVSAVVLTVGLLGACSGEASDSVSSADVATGSVGAPDVGAVTGDGLALGAPEPARADDASAGGTADLAAAEQEPRADQAVISTGTIRSTSDDVDAARTSALDVVDDLGGLVSDEDTRTDTEGTTTRTLLVVRVPADSFAEAMERLADIGDLRASSTAAEDVTTQVLDIDVRVRVQRAGIRRITALLDRAGSLGAVIRIETELSRRQADLESLLQQQKYLADQTSLATITVEVERTGTVPDDEDRSGFLGGLQTGWDALTGAASGLATATGAVLPFAAVAAVLAAIVVPVVRRRRRQSVSG